MSKLFDALKELSVDVENTLSRFVDNDELYTKFLRRYPDDGLLPPILEAFEQKDRDAMIKTLHKMKGVSVNLGINHIAEQCEHITMLINEEQITDFSNLVDKLKADFEEVCKVIQEN